VSVSIRRIGATWDNDTGVGEGSKALEAGVELSRSVKKRRSPTPVKEIGILFMRDTP
jgi:hypothetical protein